MTPPSRPPGGSAARRGRRGVAAGRGTGAHEHASRVAVVVVSIGVVLPLVLALTTPWPAALIVRQAFAGTLGSAGPFAAAARDTVVRSAVVPAGAAPAARIDVYSPRPAPSRALPLVLLIHGGGFVGGSARSIEPFARVLASRGYAVSSLEYALAPEARHPVPVRQAAAALAWLRAHAGRFGIDPDRIVIGGDSAGAQIAGELAAAATNPSLAAALRLGPTPPRTALRGVLLLCGLYDLETVGATRFPALRTFLWSYTGYRDWTSAPGIERLSITRQATDDFPPTYLTVGDADPFESQGRELARVLESRHVPVRARFWTAGHGLGHEYQFDLATAAGRAVLADVVTFLEDRVR